MGNIRDLNSVNKKLSKFDSKSPLVWMDSHISTPIVVHTTHTHTLCSTNFITSTNLIRLMIDVLYHVVKYFLFIMKELVIEQISIMHRGGLPLGYICLSGPTPR